MKKIPLSKGLFALVDDEDFEELNKHKWHAIKSRNNYYAGRQEYEKSKHKRRVYMHNVVLKVMNKENIVDHKDLNSLNNQKYNLRECSIAQNNKNKGVYRNKKSKYIGVYFGYKGKKGQVFIAQISNDKKIIYLGSFYNEIDAAKAYDEACLKYHGEYGKTNFNQ